MKFKSIYVVLVLGLALTGCKTTPPPPSEAIASPADWQALMTKSVNPRNMGVIVFRSPSGPAFAETNRHHPGFTRDFAFTSELPSFEAEMPGRKNTTILIDTKSPASWITFQTAAELGLRPIGPVPIRRPPTHINEQMDGVAGLISTMRLGDIHIENALLYCHSGIQKLGRLGRSESINPQIVFGADLLTSFAFTRIDFANKIITFSTTDPYRPNALKTLLATEFELREDGIAVNGLVGDYKGPILIDSAGHYEMAISKPTSPRIAQLTIGDMVLRDITVTDAEFEGFGPESIPCIGHLLLKDFALILDNQQGKLYLELNR